MNIVGWVVASAGALAVIALLVWLVCVAFADLHDRIYNKGAADQRDWAANRLKSAAWWFSEDEPTMRMLMDLANANLDEWNARDAWRKRRAISPTPEGPAER